jgi:hypothetical protein
MKDNINLTMTESQRAEFKKIADQMIKFLNDNGHPHMKAIIDTNTAEMVEGVTGYTNNDFIRD